LRSPGTQRDILTEGIEDLKLIDARLESIGLKDREANPSGFRRYDPIGVDLRLHPRSLRQAPHGVLQAWDIGAALDAFRVGASQGFIAQQFAIDRSELIGDPLGALLVFGCPRGIDQTVFVVDPSDKGLHRVVIFLRDRIEFMVMASGAADAQPEKRLA